MADSVVGLYSIQSLSITNVVLFTGLALGLILLKFAITCLYNVLFHPLRNYPGPKLAAATGLVFFYKLLCGEEVAWEVAMHKKYGEVVRLGPDRLTFISPQAWKDIAGPGAGKRLENTKDWGQFAPNLRGDRSLGSEFVTATHRARRRVYAPAFSERALKEQEPLINGYANSLLEILKDHANSNQDTGVDIAKLLNCTTFDVMADLAFGEPLGLLEQSEYTPWVQAVFQNIRNLSIGRLALEYKVLGLMVRWCTPRYMKEGAQSHYNHTHDRVEKRLERGIDIGKPDIWKLAMEKTDYSELSRRHMTADAGGFMLAGTETTATLLSGLIYLLLKHPKHMRSLQTEVRALKKEELTLEVLSHLSFMTACITEGLRVYSPAPIPFFRAIPKGGNRICGEWIPERTRVAVPHFAAYHSPLNFKDPDAFIPERWFPGTGYENDRKDVFNPFSVGPRNCIGQNLANHEMRIILALLIWNFDFELCPESEGWLDQKVHFLWVKPQLLVKAKYIR